MAADVECHHEVSIQPPQKPGWTLCLQWCTYTYDDGREPQGGYRFIWRRPDGSLQPAHGQARLPSIADALYLMSEAMQAGWGYNAGGRYATAESRPRPFSAVC